MNVNVQICYMIPEWQMIYYFVYHRKYVNILTYSYDWDVVKKNIERAIYCENSVSSFLCYWSMDISKNMIRRKYNLYIVIR